MDTKKRLLSKIDDINKYLEELHTISPTSLEEYKESIEKKRACERLLQILIESVIDISYLLYKYKNIGVPKDDDSVIEDLHKKKVVNKKIKDLILELKGFRNILVHKYGTVDDELVFENSTENINDFEELKDYFLGIIK